jgi:hypothetical protein
MNAASPASHSAARAYSASGFTDSVHGFAPLTMLRSLVRSAPQDIIHAAAEVTPPHLGITRHGPMLATGSKPPREKPQQTLACGPSSRGPSSLLLRRDGSRADRAPALPLWSAGRCRGSRWLRGRLVHRRLQGSVGPLVRQHWRDLRATRRYGKTMSMTRWLRCAGGSAVAPRPITGAMQTR